MGPLDRVPELIVGLMAGAGRGQSDEATALALSSLSAFPADAGLLARALDVHLDWLEAEPAASPHTRRALEAGPLEAWQSGAALEGGAGLAHAVAAVAAGRRGNDLVAEAALLTALTHPCPDGVLAATATALALRFLVDGAAYERAWQSAAAHLETVEVGTLVSSLGDDYACRVDSAVPEARGAVQDAVESGLAGRAAADGSRLAALASVVSAGRVDTWAVDRSPPDVATAVPAITGAVLAARGLAPPDLLPAGLSGGPLWSAWPRGVTGLEAVRRIEEACRRAAGIVTRSGQPEHRTPFAVSRLHPQVLYGQNPLLVEEATALVAAGVSHVLDLREPWEWEGPNRLGSEAVAWWSEQGTRRMHLPIPDGGAPSRDAIGAAVAFIDEAVAGGGTVFVHCRAGKERSGLVLLAWILPRGGDLQALQKLAPGLRPLPDQQAAAYDWWRTRL
jgi:rhodanese-related sulfurtransferase